MSDELLRYLWTSRTRFNRHAEAAEEIEHLQAEIAEFRRQYLKVVAERDRWTRCAERLAEWETKEDLLKAMDLYYENIKLDRKAVRDE